MNFNIAQSFSFIIIAVIYTYQYIIFHKKGISAKGGSLSFAVFYAMLSYFVFEEFEHIDFLLILFPVLSLLVTILQWREKDSPAWLQTTLLSLSIMLVAAGVYTFWQNTM